MTVRFDFSLPGSMRRIVGDRARWGDFEVLEPSPFDASVADIEQEDHAVQSRRSGWSAANPPQALCSRG